MDSFELLEHTADIGIEATAGEREGLAEQCGYGLTYLLFGDQKDSGNSGKLTRAVRASGNGAEETLVNWLNELLFALTERDLRCREIRVSHFSETEIMAELQGERSDSVNHPMLREIKAVTHHQTRIDHAGDCWHARVYLDL
ncbi:MAG: hypothetical protein C0623_01535 [Desulfuromonas sp.]|nr:MAG: hypothetical protein C0623_01535 [Desulfuromonas sp.]